MNGEDRGPLAGWVIALAGGRTLLGQLVLSGLGQELSPVYELQAQMGVTPQGQLATMRHVFPVLTYPTIKSVVLAPGVVTVPMDALHINDRRELAKGVANCEDLMAQMRAQQSGIVIAPANTKLPGARQ